MRMLSKIKSGKNEYLGGEYWNDVAEKMDNFYVDNPYFQYKKRELLRLVNLWGKDKLDKKILKTDLYEESLGYDDFLFDLAKNNEDVCGMDISSKIVDMAKERAEKLGVKPKLVVQDARKMDFENESFDLIISNSTFDHFPEIDEAISECGRVLKTGGILIMTILNKDNLLLYLLCKIMKFFNKYHSFYTEGVYSIREIKSLIKCAGLDMIDSTAILHVPPVFPTLINVLYRNNFSIFKKPVSLLVKIFEIWGRQDTFLNYLTGYLLAVKAVKK